MKKITSAALLICLMISILLSSLALAWMSDNGMSSPVDITSNLRKSYFQSGDGKSKETAYEIATEKQLYYFAWLQYLGYFNQSKDGYIAPLYFKVSNDLDMKDFILPPIGTTTNPFLGNFDAMGHIISNLTVRNTYESLKDLPADTTSVSGAEIIGFFGVVGELEGGFDYNYEESVNEVKNLIIDNITVETLTPNALIGLVAGYVNGFVDRVGVVNSTVKIKENTVPLSYSDNVSDYTLIGYCTDGFKNKMFSADLYLYDPNTNSYPIFLNNTSGEDGEGWGGSVAMKDIFTWLSAVSTEAQKTGNVNGNYVYERTDVVNLAGKHITVGEPSTGSRPSLSIPEFGSFVFGQNSTTGDTAVNFVGGGQKVTAYEYFETDTTTPVYSIKIGEEYLVFDGNAVQRTTSKPPLERAWYITENDGKDVIFTVYDKTVYYLTESLTIISAIDVDHEDLPTWDDEDNDNTYEMSGGFKISLSARIGNTTTTFYLNCNDAYSDVTKGTDEANATVWYINEVNNGYTISTTVNENTYYLTHNSNNSDPGLSDETNDYTTWQYAKNGNTITLSYGSWYRTYYLRFNAGNNANNSNWQIGTSTSNRNLTVTEVAGTTVSTEMAGEAKNVGFTKSISIDDSLSNRYYDENLVEQPTGAGITYFPLSSTFNKETTDQAEILASLGVSGGNTGYIIGAEWGLVGDDWKNAGLNKEQHDSNYSNIRISKYKNSLTNVSSPYTMTYQNYTDKTFEQITSSNLAGLGLVKYAECSAEFSKLFADNSCYGLHFMDATVSKNNTTRITAQLKGETKPNYEVPLNCIDFHLYDSGFINFLAGSYYKIFQPYNNSFFSIYEIVRDGNDIEEIREIYKIYGTITGNGNDKKIDTTDLTPNDGINNPYVYTYVGYDDEGNRIEVDAEGNPVTGGISGKDMIFDCDWITNPMAYAPVTTSSSFNDKAFYFEVPVNEGEYAIGSTSGKTGAYLVYLDLAANAQEVERTRIDEKSETNEYAYDIPNGVSILESNLAGYDTTNIRSENSAFISIAENLPGATLTQTGLVITDSGVGHTAAFVGSGLTLLDGAGETMLPVRTVTKNITVETTTFYDRNIVTKAETKTVIKTTTVTEGNTKTVSYTVEHTSNEDGQEVTKTYGPYTALPDLFKLCKFTVDPDSAPPQGEFNNVLLNAQYSVSDTSKFALDFTYTPTGQGGATSSSYAISAKNETGGDVRLALDLTSYWEDNSDISFEFEGTSITDSLVQTVEAASEENPSGEDQITS